MRITEITASIADLVLSPEQIATRSPGVHVSAVIQHMKNVIKPQGKWDQEELSNAGQLGRIWETLVAKALAEASLTPDNYVRPGEFECDGIIGSPDGLRLDTLAIVEYKATYRSSRHAIFPEWLWQIKSYCHMLATNKAELYCLYLCGNWKPPQPQYKAWELEFTPGELRDNWQMILRNAEDLRNGN